MNLPTIVTAYYRIPSKHSDAEYDAWIKTFAETLENPVVFFGEPEWCERFNKLRGNRPTALLELPFDKLYCHSIAPWDTVLKNDKYQHLHTIPLYIVWNEKSCFVSRALQENPFDSEVFAWMDAGCFRMPERAWKCRNWPISNRLQSTDLNRITLVQVQPFMPDDGAINSDGLPADFHGTNRIGGTILLGGKQAWGNWIPAFYEMVDKFIKAGRHCGLDQNAISALALTRPDLVNLVTPPEDVDQWFYLQEYFTDSQRDG